MYEPAVSRNGCRILCETVWKDILADTLRGDVDAAEARIKRFMAFMEHDSSLRSPKDKEQYVADVNTEWNILLEESKRDNAALVKRLGVGVRSASPAAVPVHQGLQQQGIGEMVARTAVRATIWSAIRAMFR
jgi:hypothetical protein